MGVMAQKTKRTENMKDYINKNAKVISMNKISRDNIIYAGAEMQTYLDEYGIALDLDDFSSTNGAVFINEEQSLKESCTYRVLSCILLDLGLLKDSNR